MVGNDQKLADMIAVVAVKEVGGGYLPIMNT